MVEWVAPPARRRSDCCSPRRPRPPATGVVGLGGELAEGGHDSRHAARQGRQRHGARDAGQGRRALHAPRHEARASSGARRSNVAAHGERRLSRRGRAARAPRARHLLPVRPARRRSGAGRYGCATAAARGAIKGGTGRSASAARPGRAGETCSPGGRTLSQPGMRVYPETGNTGYTSVHTDVNLVYDAPSNMFLPGTHVDLQQRATQCLTEFSLDFERTNGVTSTTTPGPNMSVQSVTINGQPATFTFKQPTYPGNPNGPDDPDPPRTPRRTSTRSARPTRTRRRARRSATHAAPAGRASAPRTSS